MKKVLTTILALTAVIAVQAAKPRTSLVVKDTRKQTISGFGGACCDGAMCPFGNDNACVKKLYGPNSKIGLNILRMEISPNFEGDIIVPEWGNWDSPYDWNGSLPSAKIVKQRGGIVFGTPWSPPGEYKTNGSAQGGNADDQGNVKATLRRDCYDKFFPWLNTFLKWMKQKGVAVDAVSLQNEPDWWVSYSGCCYEPDSLVSLVKNYAWMLDREANPGVRLISGEPLGFTKNYTDPLMKDPTCREQIDIVAGHLYGHLPLQYMKPAGVLPLSYGKELWMTEHSTTDNTGALPTWSDNLIFAEELNECMLAGCTGYIYWYLRAHWSFAGTGETKYGAENKKDELLPRAFVMSHFSKNVTGSTRLVTNQDADAGRTKEEILQNYQYSAYIQGDTALIVMGINATDKERDVKITLPYNVKSGQLWLSTGNESENLCQKSELEDITESTKEYLYTMPAMSLNTLIFKIDKGSTAIENVKQDDDDDDATPKTYYDLQGRKMEHPHGLCIERSANGSSRKVMFRN
jgi:glucuronoarabinoxylan endo-1,4-beta-xylanase